ncbi:MAG: sulfatase-like hydrolase/transferase, partial [Planctomycetota bacterium]|nr:sulfatase-like hydrolase/transferase [Planctomycetota bacterium]
TSLADRQDNLTPYLATLAKQGVEFTNARSSVPHTNKALFALLTGRFPSPSQDVAEAVPVAKPYASIAAILKQKLNFRTACFESANGSFECWPGLAYNLGFDKFWAREDLNDPNAFVGYFASDEFSMLKPITEWIKADERPFCLVIMCSVSHDPYVVPKWFATPAKEPVERYRQTISYTDKFLAALDAELGKLGLADKTILCVISDHGEAFGEHGFFAHERIMFEEVLHIPWVMRAPSLVEPGAKVTEPVSSVDLAPTVLTLFGFETKDAGFDGVNALGPIPADRKVYFSCWTRLGPAGFVEGSRKFIYNPANKMVCEYDVSNDPLESVRLTLPEQQARHIADEIIAWRKDRIFQISQQRTGKIILFDRWLCHSAGRVSSAQYENLSTGGSRTAPTRFNAL